MRNFTRNFLLAFFLCSVASLLTLHQLNYTLTGIDDANIYFVYARNLANGHGFVYNAGGERVEGFTSLLWTVISALVFKFSSYPELVLLIINIILMSLAIAYILNHMQLAFWDKNTNRRIKPLLLAIFLILLFTSPRYMVWNTVTLMENGLWSALLVMMTIFVIRDHPSAATINFKFIPLSILLLLTRPESIVWVPVFATILFMRLASTSNAVDALRALAPSIACIAASLVLLTLFRLQYFGYPLPNTYYAKVSPSFTYNLQQGAIYLFRYSVSELVVMLSIIATCVASLQIARGIVSRQIPRNGAFFLPVIVWTGLLLPLFTGGDHFGSFRLYQSIYPIELMCLLYVTGRIASQPAMLGWYPDASQGKRRVFNFILLPLVFLGFLLHQAYIWTQFKSEVDVDFRIAVYGRKNGAFIQKSFSSLSKLPSLGVVTSGGIKYSYPGEIVDLMGLNNTIMAHNPGDRRGIKNHAAFDIPTFYQLQPDILWPLTVIEKDWHYSESEIQRSWENQEGLKRIIRRAPFFGALCICKGEQQNR